MDKKTTAHIVSHSHWDREWYMPFEKHRFDMVKLIDNLLDLFKNDDRFRSFHLDGQTILLEDYLEIRPDRKDELKKAIQDKKLYIGPWYVLQDAFLTSSEANVRNMLYGMQDSNEYGQPVMIGYFPDTFGIYGQAPQLLQQAGIETAGFGRGVKPTGFNNTVGEMQSYESPFSEMHWVSPDGSSVLGILFANWYSNGNEIPTNQDAAQKYWETKLADAKKYASTNQLLYMNGCDHQPVQKDMGDAIQLANEMYEDIEFVHSNFPDYMDAVKQHLPDGLQSIHGELRNQRTDGWATLVNTASARIYLKQMNQKSQSLLERKAEPLSVMASLLGFEYPKQYLKYAWKTLMKNHPHDSICGCSVDEVHREMVTRFEKVEQTAEMIIAENVQNIASLIETKPSFTDDEQVIPLIVFNTSGWSKDEVITKEVEVEKVFFADMSFEEIPSYLEQKQLPSFILKDAQGNEQLLTVKDLGVRFGYDLPDDGFRRAYFARVVEVQFLAQALPQFGYQTYYVMPQVEVSETLLETSPIAKSERELENEHLHVHIHDNGAYTLTDKASGKVFEHLGMYEDTGDIGNEYMFKMTGNSEALTTSDVTAEIKLVENTAVRATVEIRHQWEVPASADAAFDEEKARLVWHKDRKAGRAKDMKTINMTTLLTLDKAAKGISLKATMLNTAKDHRIRVLYPTKLNITDHYADSIFEVVKRSNKPEPEWENPSFDHHQQAFVGVSDDHHGLTIANRGLHEYEVLSEDSTVAVTILRAVSELGDWGDFPTPEAQCLGENTAEWFVIPHQGTVINSDAMQHAYQYQSDATVLQSDMHPGSYASAHSFMEWEAPPLAMTSCKMAEENEDIILRWFNASQDKVTLTHTFAQGKKAYLSNIIEQKTTQPLLEENKIEVNPYEILTIGWEK
ncbi:alpha-mannosidase [Longirhabdus pacifica]|uniref:alpha-mannosidase n=1 Tax=Longirhabdus pacifica TaxID=2305227 RepID=UPI001008BBFC|nr:alpha-mannosidase [Longirhabdus pacifica]